MTELKGIIEIEREPADQLRTVINKQGSQIRLSELKQAYDGPAFNTALVGLLEAGEISLYPVGNVVKVERN